jgi:hypothetical protein
MIIDSINIEDLGDNAEEAFVIFEERLRESLWRAKEEDRRLYTKSNGFYEGSYSPERYYVSSILAFLDEYDLHQMDVPDITTVDNDDFLHRFDEFFNKVNYARTRLKLRKARIDTGQGGTPIIIKAQFRDEIHGHLDTIRKIVNAHIRDEGKKDAIYKKISALQSEIDRSRTTVDAVFGRAIALSKVLYECGENLEPLIQRFERVMAALYRGSDCFPLLPKRERPKLLPKSEGRPKLPHDLDDDIPF